MNHNEQERIFRLSHVPISFDPHRHEFSFLHELKARQLEIENQLDDLKSQEKILRSTVKRYADLYENASTGLMKLSSSGKIKEVNFKACFDLESTRRRMLDSTFTDFILEEDLPVFFQHCHEVIASGKEVTCVLHLKTGSGMIVEWQIVSIAKRDAIDDTQMIHVSLRSLSAGPRTLHDLQEAYDKSEASNSAKSLFLANMSHEMRTPLGVIIGFTDLLLNSPSEEDNRQGLKTIHRNGIHLLNLIDDLLDLAKIEAGKLTLEIMPFRIAQELETILSQFSKKAESKGLRLLLNTDQGLPDQILTDPIRFRQIVLNVLSNALKFTTEGSIEVQLSLVAAKGLGEFGRSLICIDVIDTGCGISKDSIEHLFEAFMQGDPSTTRRFGGTGLGLCLSKRFAMALGGDLEVLRSEQGKGSTFRITLDPVLIDRNPESLVELPAMDVAGDSIDIVEIPSLDGIKILVVEDAPDNQILIKTILENVGAEVECVEDGMEAIASALVEEYDVVLMDIQLPFMDGYEAMSHLRRHGCNTPIIALTAHALHEDRQRAESAGFDGFVSKPINWATLASAIVHCRNGLYH